jgi:hypothetical protein
LGINRKLGENIMSRSKNTAPRNKTSKGDALDKWTPTATFHANYDSIDWCKKLYYLITDLKGNELYRFNSKIERLEFIVTAKALPLAWTCKDVEI